MGVLKTLGCAFAATIIAVPLPAAEEKLLHRVAECVGRLSAQIEHRWLFADRPTDLIEKDQRHLIDILNSLITPDTAALGLAARIDAKMAHAALLTQAAFSEDARSANWANKRANQEIRLCVDILLPTQPQVSQTRSRVGSTPVLSVNQQTRIALQ
ncbi:MAG: hypothetical protein ACSHXH_16275 [Marivita sp.]|uniref:hypothetical protein n=1 Tax=Marivita sp. TaxID=2003365 RepID=UPI003EF6426F